MERIPLEICERMFSFACTDDGKTGCSLALVSKYVRDASRRARLQSIALESYGQLRKFCSLLEKLPPRQRIVRNILITAPNSPDAPDTDNIGRQAALRAIRAWKDGLHEQGKEASLVIARVVNFIAPTVRVLAFYIPHESQITLTHISVRLPVLEELTVTDASILCPLTITESIELFPNLKRVHFAGPYVDHLDHVLELLPQFGASVTHVRMTGLEQSRRDPYELKVALSAVSFTSEKGVNAGQGPLVLPTTLQEIVVQMGPVPSMDFRIFSPNVLPYEVVQDHFQELTKDSSGCKISILPAQIDMNDYDYNVAKRMWMDRVNDRPGCWLL